MSSDVVLTAALRNNLLSLQNTQSLIDQTQLKLATGRAVNSALDNPQNFFAAQSLNNRADDLNRLLDGIGQSITAIEQTDTALQSLQGLVDQADSIAQQARDALSGGQQEAKIAGGVNLNGISDLTTVTGIANNDVLTFTFVDDDGTQATQNVTITNAVAGTFQATSAEELVTQINAIQTTNTNEQVFSARLDDSGQLEITEANGNSFQVDFQSAGATLATDNTFANALGFGNFTTNVNNNSGFAEAADLVRITVSNSASIETSALFASGGNGVATRSTELADLRAGSDSSTTAIFAGEATDTIAIGVNGGTAVTVATNLTTTSGATVQDLIDGINGNASLNELIEATFDETTGQINIRATDSSVTDLQISAVDVATGGTAASVNLLELGIGVTTIDAGDGTANDVETESIQLGAAASDLATLEAEYNSIRTQIDALVSDSGYRGTNLLNGDDLTTFFNEDRSNSLTTEGEVLTSAGLGISEANFGRTASVDGALDETRAATLQIREFNSSVANDLAVLQTRQDFTTQTINNLTAGADKLTIADQNEEGANLLALQTRQQLGVTSLSLASQSQQAVLRLF